MPSGRVVKNGSKRRSRCSFAMPVPSSRTTSATYDPGWVPGCSPTKAASRSASAVSMVSRPPAGMASRELMTRFVITCSSPARSAFTRPRAAGITTRLMSSPMRRRSKGASSLTTAVRSRTRGWSTCLRLKARSCWVSSVARSAVFRICSMLE